MGALGESWALWLIAPLVVPVLVALAMWWRGRPRRPATIRESIDGHQGYLLALGRAAALTDGSGASRTTRRGDDEPD